MFPFLDVLTINTDYIVRLTRTREGDTPLPPRYILDSGYQRAKMETTVL